MLGTAVSYRLLPIVVTLLALFFGGTFCAQPATAQTQPPSQTEGPSVDAALARKLKSPRQTMQTFIDCMRQDNKLGALSCLDFSGTAGTDESRTTAGIDLAYKLNDVIDRTMLLDISLISDDSDYAGEYAIHVGQPGVDDEYMSDAALITLTRGNDDLWRFSAATIREIDDLWERAQERPKLSGLEVTQASKPPQVWIREQFPPELREKRFLLRDYQWICLASFIFIGFIADYVVRQILHLLTSTWFRYVRKKERKEAEKRTWKPMGLLAQALVWYFGCRLVDLPPPVLAVLLVAMKAFTVFAAIWTIFRVIDLIRDLTLRRIALTDTKMDDLLVNLGAKTLKTLAVCMGVVLFCQLFDRDVWGLLGGLGIGGIAIALAAKDALGNLFGSMTVVMDRPFEIGDWIATEDVEGTVESVGMRSTRIRTFYNSQIILPNNRLTTAIVDNMGRRKYRRIREVLGVEYGVSPEQLDAFCEGIRELIRRHPYTRKDYFHVYFNGYGPSSLDVLLYCFLECPDWATELREKHRLLSNIYQLASELKIGFAFPTQTVHLHRTSDEEVTADLPNPEESGRSIAASIAGPTLSSHERPGPVKIA